MKKRISLLGSAFDPLHYGHAALVPLLLESFADEVWLAPCPARWDKTPIASSEQRLKWTNIACGIMKEWGFNVSVSERELEFDAYRGSYTLLKTLERENAECTFELVVGEDAYAGIPKWRDPVTGIINGHLLLQEFGIIVAPRGPVTIHSEHKSKKMLPSFVEKQALLEKYFSEPLSLSSISSTELRRALVKLKSPNSSQKEWTAAEKMTFKEIINEIKLNNPY